MRLVLKTSVLGLFVVLSSIPAGAQWPQIPNPIDVVRHNPLPPPPDPILAGTQRAGQRVVGKTEQTVDNANNAATQTAGAAEQAKNTAAEFEKTAKETNAAITDLRDRLAKLAEQADVSAKKIAGLVVPLTILLYALVALATISVLMKAVALVKSLGRTAA